MNSMFASTSTNSNKIPSPPHDGDNYCRVCDVQGATRHYGSICCSGCKGFFRRSIRFQMAYKCPREGNCPLQNKYRNCCRACRLQKCLHVGMDPKREFVIKCYLRHIHIVVQSEWGKSGKNQTEKEGGDGDVALVKFVGSTNGKNNRQKGNSSLVIVHHNKLLNNDSGSLALGMTKIVPPCLERGNTGALANFLVSVERFCELFSDTNLPCSFMEMATQITKRPQILPTFNMEIPVEIAHRQPAKICQRFPLGMGKPTFQTQLGMFGLAYARLMVHYFDWASHFDEFEAMAEDDRRIQLTGRAMQCLWLFLCFRSAQLHFDGFAVSCDMFYPMDQQSLEAIAPELRNSALLESICQAMAELVQPFRKMQLTEEEFALLRAIALFTPVAGLSREGNRQIESFQSKYLAALGDLIQQRERTKMANKNDENGGTFASSICRMNRLLMFLACIERINQQSCSTFSAFSAFGTGGMRGSFTFDMHLDH